MRIHQSTLPALAACIAAASYVTQPMGPAVAVKPGPGKPLIVFQQDDAVCRQYAGQQLAVETAEANTASAGAAQLNIQQRFDVEYLQCMQSRGNQVPDS